MPGNSIGHIFRLTTFGESHGPAIGGVLEGFPAGFKLNLELVRHELDRRRPGQSAITTKRNEADQVEFLSGLLHDTTLGTPIAFLIRNTDQRPQDYAPLQEIYRPSHGDYTWHQKYGIPLPPGGGRASARETACRVVGGALAKQLLTTVGVEISAFVTAVGHISIPDDFDNFDPALSEANPVRCPDPVKAREMETLITKLSAEQDSTGGVIKCIAKGCPPALGEPVFHKLNAALSAAIMSVNAARGIAFGNGFKASRLKGSENNDAFTGSGTPESISTSSNRSGGIQAGLSNGSDIIFEVAFKPASTIGKPQQSVDHQGNPVMIEGKGRHDPCIVPRAVPVVEAMTALVLADFYLLQKINS